ncbi:malectin domain-containing carbohydrate-binding protein [Streptacidiphilus sp. EB103A]|uniref:malectin domain-containing carbohydrate-binding protein n=1 Tax=Streptacidiphilus sp. EB103A TaxID=3156275 RepID=UPI0035150085
MPLATPMRRLVLRIVLAVITLTAANGVVQIAGLPLAAAAGTTYYVSTSGSDSNSGTSTSTPLRTIQKCADIAVAGDSCLVMAGAYHETITPANSGTSSAPITFAPYNGAAVTVDGADAVSGWTQYSTNVYVASAHLPVSNEAAVSATGLEANQVFVNGTMLPEVHWPAVAGADPSHPATSVADATSSTGVIGDAKMPNINWTGAIVHWYNAKAWSDQSGVVTSYADTTEPTITFSRSNSGDTAGSGAHYYLTGGNNGLAALTSAGQWWYDWANSKLYVWTPKGDSPSNYTVEARQRKNGFDLSGRSYVNVTGLNLLSSTVLTSSTSSHNTLDGITAQYLNQFYTSTNDPNETSGGCGIYCTHASYTGILLQGSYETLENSTIAYTAGNGVLIRGANMTVTNNLIHDTDTSGTYNAAVKWLAYNTSDVDSFTISHNTIYNTGRDGIDSSLVTAADSTSQISYNNVFDFGLQTADLGGIYTVNASNNGNGTSIDHNWVHDATTVISSNYAAGVYVDNSANGYTVHHNVVWNVGTGITINGSGGDQTSRNNLIYNNTIGPVPWHSIGGLSSSSTGTVIENNILGYSSIAADTSASHATMTDNLAVTTQPGTLFTDPVNGDFHPLSTASAAIDKGQVIPGITDGYVGSAPDLGAYEYGGTDWSPGCSLIGCVTRLSTSTYTAISAGGGASGAYVADTDYASGGGTNSTSHAVDTSAVTNPAPQSVYQHERYGNSTYTVPNLVAGMNYTVRLHFSENYFNAAGKRSFNVSINGTQVLTNFDIYATTGAEYKAVVQQFTAVPNADKAIVVTFTSVTDNAKVDGIEIVPQSLSVNAGGSATGSYQADMSYMSSNTTAAASTTSTVTTTGVTSPAPQAVYQSNRYGTTVAYLVSGFKSGASYTVRLNFADNYYNATGKRVFTVDINNVPALTNFDIVAAAGGENAAVDETFTATANASGQIMLNAFASLDHAQFNGFAITAQ